MLLVEMKLGHVILKYARKLLYFALYTTTQESEERGGKEFMLQIVRESPCNQPFYRTIIEIPFY